MLRALLTCAVGDGPFFSFVMRSISAPEVKREV